MLSTGRIGLVGRRRYVVALVTTLASSSGAQGRLLPTSELGRYIRLLELEGKIAGTPLVFHTASLAPRLDGLRADSVHLWSAHDALRPAPSSSARGTVTVRPLAAELSLIYNSSFPRTGNDGAIWAGKGPTLALQGGVDASWRSLRVRLNPVAGYATNQSFPLGSGLQSFRSPYAYPWANGIDYPQRFGEEAVRYVDWGQSGIRVDRGRFTLGLSTENMWWGPAAHNAIIMTNSAAGFPHVDVGTGRAVATRFGDVEVRAVWGALAKSGFFYDSAGDGRRVFDGLTIGYRPRFLPGLTVGATRALYHNWPRSGLGVFDFTDAFEPPWNTGWSDTLGVRRNDSRDQLISLVARWVMPAAQFEAYVEWARNDFTAGIAELLQSPGASQGVTVGFQKALPMRDGRLLLSGELTNLARGQVVDLRPTPTFYVHTTVVEGYTHRGQMLGAAIGPGSNSQHLGLDRYHARGRYGVFLERVRYDDDYAFAALKNVPQGYQSHQTDVTLGGSIFRFSSPLEFGATVEATHEYARYFVYQHTAHNLKVSLSVGRAGGNGR